MIISSTPHIEGYNIDTYKGLVFTSEVIGVNIISEAIASFTDVFGGKSGQYRQKLDEMYISLENSLQQKAKALGANAIIGVHFDFNELTGKGLSMIMATVTGTAATISVDRYAISRKKLDLKEFFNNGIINQEEYDFELQKLAKSQEDIIAVESGLRQAAIEAAKALKEEQEARIQAQIAHKEEIKDQYKALLDQINNLVDSDVESSDFSSFVSDESKSMDEICVNLLKESLVAEAANYYVSNTGLDITDAKEYLLGLLDEL